MYHTFKKGQIAVLHVQQRALEKDIVVCIPTVECRYDLVLVYPNGECKRAQVKYADASTSLYEGSVTLDLRKETRNDGDKKTYSEEEIDILLVYLPKINKVLHFGREVFSGRKSLNIRYELPKNNQKKGITLCQDFIW